MDSSAPNTVARGVTITAAVSALLTGVHGTLRGRANVGLLSASAAFNGGITAATFFSFREYLVSPVLLSSFSGAQYAQRRKDIGKTPLDSDEKFETCSAQFRTYKLLNSTISGSFAGGILNALRAGSRAAIPGVATGGLVCMLLQLGYNELALARIKYVSQTIYPSSNGSATHSALPATQENEPLSRWFFSKLGLHQVSDEQYLRKLIRTRDGYLARIRILEDEAEEKRRVLSMAEKEG